MTTTGWPGHRGNWGRWDDGRGTLNLVTSEVVLSAVATVRSGRVLPLSRKLDVTDPPYYPQAAPAAFQHEMITASGSNAGGPVLAASDQITVQNHGLAVTHLDAICHIGFEGVGFDGLPFEQIVTMERAALRSGIQDAMPIVTRGVLADIARHRGVERLEPGDPVRLEELMDASPDLRPGDALIVRTGAWRTPGQPTGAKDRYGRLTGLHVECMDYLREADIGVLGTDGPGDNFPVTSPDCPLPIHVLALTFLGVHLVHNMDLEALADACAEESRNSFLFCVSPLNIPGGTGSPVTPVAVL
jgi:kynurenine formamidase